MQVYMVIDYGLNGMNWMRVLNDSGDIQGPVHKVKNLAKKNRDVQTELNMMERTGMSTTGSLPMNTNNGFCRYVRACRMRSRLWCK